MDLFKLCFSHISKGQNKYQSSISIQTTLCKSSAKYLREFVLYPQDMCFECIRQNFHLKVLLNHNQDSQVWLKHKWLWDLSDVSWTQWVQSSNNCCQYTTERVINNDVSRSTYSWLFVVYHRTGDTRLLPPVVPSGSLVVTSIPNVPYSHIDTHTEIYPSII